MADFRSTVLGNGIRVVTEDYPQSKSVAVGVWVDTGTRDENPRHMGVSHLLEHLVFKGTKRRNAFELASVMESVGGDLNAHTTKEYTCFHSLALHENLDLAVDAVCDLVGSPTFPRSDFEVERHVVLQEINSSADDVDDWIYDLFFEEFYRGNPLAWPILGTEETIGSVRRSDVVKFHKDEYHAGNVLVSAAGRLEHDRVVEYVENGLGHLRKRRLVRERKKPKTRVFRSVVEKDLEQVHILIGLPATSFKDRLRFESFILNALLGGGMTSSLYQKIREERGLVYSIFSSLTTFTDSGLINVYASTSPQHVRKVITLILSELRRVQRSKVRKKDLELFRTQVRGGLLLGSEDIDNRMNSLGVNEMVFGRYRPVDEIIEELGKVSVDSMENYIDRFLKPEDVSILLVGPVAEKDRLWLEELES